MDLLGSKKEILPVREAGSGDKKRNVGALKRAGKRFSQQRKRRRKNLRKTQTLVPRRKGRNLFERGQIQKSWRGKENRSKRTKDPFQHGGNDFLPERRGLRWLKRAGMGRSFPAGKRDLPGGGGSQSYHIF